MASDPLMSQDEIERLFSQTKERMSAEAGEASPAGGESNAPAEAADRPMGGAAPSDKASDSSQDGISSNDIDFLLSQAERALESVDHGADTALPPGLASYKFEDLSASPPPAEAASLDLIRDVELDLKIELGRTNM